MGTHRVGGLLARSFIAMVPAVLAVACAQDPGVPDGRLAVTTWEVVAQPRDSGPELRFVGMDSVWTAPGRPGAGGVRSALAGPMSEMDPQWEPVRSILLTMASQARLTPLDTLPRTPETGEASRPWLLELPLDAGSRIRGRYPVSYERSESGAWVGEGPLRRDFLWIRRVGEIPDTVRIQVEGTLTDTVGVLSEARALNAQGTLFVASLGRTLELRVRMRGTVARVPEEEVARRHGETAERLERGLGEREPGEREPGEAGLGEPER